MDVAVAFNISICNSHIYQCVILHVPQPTNNDYTPLGYNHIVEYNILGNNETPTDVFDVNLKPVNR